MTRVVGESGPPVLLLPGGAESADGFFPIITEGLVADPGCRIIVHDRPGTGASTAPGGLREAADHLHGVIREVGLGPVVIVGQSLGAAVALLFAAEHPDDVAGMVLLDPTPVNDAVLARRTATGARRIVGLARVPVIGGAIPALLRRSAARLGRSHPDDPGVVAAVDAMTRIDLPKLLRATVGLPELADAFDAARLPRGRPGVVVTADRKPGHIVRRAHERVAAALDVPLVSWPGADHAVHLTHPDEVLEVARAVVREVLAA